ncbi:hypothetical protein B0A50_06753 [Salinomyces thailandicus]|uniref:Uncharacterized protein n=1 Tax=Salinomyces thailandicus TaxID=706561 RepID=A0A4U0TQN6_9PEZI|nr:hypothetical protein B0A50_06753 [Salinomyces thailandica]
MSNQSRPVSPDGAATFEELAQFLDNADDRRAITNLEAILALGRKINQQSFSLKLKLKQEELESKDQLVVQSMRRVLAAEGALELQVVDGDALSTQLETKDAEIDKLKAWLEKIERDFELQVTDGVEERSRLENMKADNALFKAAFEMQTKGSVALHHQLEGKDAEIDSLKAQLEKTQEALELLGRDDIDLRGQLAGSDSKVASLKDGLDLQKKGSVALRRQIESRNAEVASLKARLEKKEEAFEANVQDQQMVSNQKHKQCEKDLGTVHSDTATLERDRAAATAKYGGRKVRLEKKMQEMTVLDAQCKDLICKLLVLPGEYCDKKSTATSSSVAARKCILN